MYEDRLPPHDDDAEAAVIGSLLLDGEAISKVSSFLQAEDFFREKNRWAYDACLSLYERGEAINQVTVAHALAQKERLKDVGGAAYLSTLVAQLPTSLHAEYYAQIVHNTSMMRRLISTGGQIAAIGYEGGPDVDTALNKAEDLLFRLRHGQASRDFVHIREVLNLYLEESTALRQPQEGHLPQIPTGFVDLDKILGGLQRSDMIVLAARPGIGKTSLALNIARNGALRHGVRVAIFSLEMSKLELAYRFLANESGVDTQKLRLGQYGAEEERAIIEATGALSEAPIYIDDSAFLRDGEMRGKARRLHHEHGIDLIVVDYLQLMRSMRATDNRVQEMSDISHAIKSLARDLNVPVVAVSQLSREPERRLSHEPLLSDLRESGSIEQDADVVMFIYREEMYTTQEEWERHNLDKRYPKGIADLIIAKHRNGPVGRVKLFFLEKTAQFRDLAQREKV